MKTDDPDAIVYTVPIEEHVTFKDSARHRRARRRKGRHADEMERLPDEDVVVDENARAHLNRRESGRYFRVPNSRSLSRR